MPDILLHTKLFLPTLPPNLVPRPHLIKRLNQNLQPGHKLALISAPAGFGKTTLVLDWIRDSLPKSDFQSGMVPRFCWLSLDKDDNEPTQFLQYFVAALQKVEDSIGQACLSLLQGPQPPPLQNIVALLINDLALSSLQSPIILVLDDLHAISNRVVYQALTFLLERMPPNFHLVVVTRSDPPLLLSQLRVRGQMTEIRETDLRITVEETASFLGQRHGVELPVEQIAVLATRTEGWVAALQLAALALQGHDSARQMTFVTSFGSGHAHIADYLMDEVWQRQSENVQSFWLATSVLDRLSGPLCDAVTERNDSQQILAQLHQRNLFLISLDNQHHWFRYHRLFADMLRKRVAGLGAKEITQLHQRTAAWYEQQQLLPQAVHHALAAADQGEAARLISLAAGLALRQGELTAVQGWLEALPADLVRADHQLALSRAWVSYLAGQVETAVSYLDAAQRAWPANPGPEQQASLISLQAFIAILRGDVTTGITLSKDALAIVTDENDSLRELILFNLMQAQTMVGDIAAAVQSGRLAIRVGLKKGSSFLAANILEGTVQLLLLQGKLREAIQIGQEAISRFVDNWQKPLPTAGQLYIALGQAEFERGAFERASTLVQQGIALSQQMAATLPILNGKLRLAQIHQSQGQGELALAALAEVRQINEVPQLELICSAVEADMNLRQGHLPTALTWAQSADIDFLESSVLRFEIIWLVYARCLLAEKRWSTADTLLQKLAQTAREQGRAGSLVPIMILQALSKQAQGKRPEAESTLREAVMIATSEGHKRPFLDDLTELQPLLQAIRPAAPDFVADLLRHFDLPALATPQATLPTPLNDRENEILHLIAAGFSNPEIASELYLTVNTIKWYVKSIFQKLDVSNRKEASARARDLGLVR